MFNAKRLSLARKRRRMTGKALAEKAELAVDTISRLEKGNNEPDELTIAKLAKATRFPVEFFTEQDPEEIDTASVSFRSFSKMSARERDAAISAGSLGLQLNDWVEARFGLPKANLIDLSYETSPSVAAMLLRQHWSLGERPIGNMLGLLETQGVRVFSLSENTASVNAFSFWRDNKPFVFLNNFKTAESSIFDTAHELGHLVMHKHGDPKESRAAEREADAFASAFLMPENDVKARMPRPVSLEIVLKAKMRWRVSAMAMAYRLHNLGIVTEWQYKNLCIELTKRRYRSEEPVGIERETSIVWKKILLQLWQERTTKTDIAKALRLPLDELEGLIWNLAGVVETPERSPRGNLRAVS
ncbi:ImmA/IrrE family metallo-endopeptidase [Methylobacterium sp. C25]|uniref:helix-turn-helix domain-containing protein n=1 Tax=Methylobacterium sp. C25 TaxID=2721622 RepID=UPI001F47DF4F|nr:XRE family transcriptional regulator [Methylobacterium sp. C25]MCE4223417.1 ImmA/IrrE family metallo-endopeptidase [Methylobacterium sp. C25]